LVIALERSPRRLSHKEIEVGALGSWLGSWLAAISIFGVIAMFALTATLSHIKTASWW
jgi:hypothetical protein